MEEFRPFHDLLKELNMKMPLPVQDRKGGEEHGYAALEQRQERRVHEFEQQVIKLTEDLRKRSQLKREELRKKNIEKRKRFFQENGERKKRSMPIKEDEKRAQEEKVGIMMKKKSKKKSKAPRKDTEEETFIEETRRLVEEINEKKERFIMMEEVGRKVQEKKLKMKLNAEKRREVLFTRLELLRRKVGREERQLVTELVSWLELLRRRKVEEEFAEELLGEVEELVRKAEEHQ